MKRLSNRVFLVGALALMAVVLSACGGMDPKTGAYNPGIFEVLAGPLRQTMVFFHDRLFVPLGSPQAWGWAIILVAVVIRVLLFPLSMRQMRAMRVASEKMKVLQPELDALKKKYAKDKQKLQEEQMKLYQKHGITQAQMAGCLPTLLQMPILFAFYYALLGLIANGKLTAAPFYFIPDLAHPSYQLGFGWLTQNFTLAKLLQPDIWPYLILPILLGITQVMTIKLSQQSQPQVDETNPAAGMMGQMTWLMTAMFVFFSLQVPAGMSLYWVVGNVLALIQQVYVNRQQEHWKQAALAPAAAKTLKDGGDMVAVMPSSDGADEDDEDDAATDQAMSTAGDGVSRARGASSLGDPSSRRKRRKRR